MSVSVPPVRNRSEVMAEIGTRLAKYMSMLLPRLTTRADTTAITQEAMKIWLSAFPSCQHSQGIRPQAKLTRTCMPTKH